MRILFLLALPAVVFVGGAWLMTELAQREAVVARHRAYLAENDQTPLNQRFHYDVNDVRRHWDALDPVTLASERTFLELDLVFPLLYGGAFGGSC